MPDGFRRDAPVAVNHNSVITSCWARPAEHTKKDQADEKSHRRFKIFMNEADEGDAEPERAARGPTCSSSLQGYPDENEESLLPRILGVWKTAIIR